MFEDEPEKTGKSHKLLNLKFHPGRGVANVFPFYFQELNKFGVLFCSE